MTTPALLQKSLLPFESVKLGRFVLNALNPLQAYHDPSETPPESAPNRWENFEKVMSLSKNSSLRSRLTALLSLSYENKDANTMTLKAVQATTYRLPNSNEWFKKACAQLETRQWLESMIEESEDMYLVIGLHTLTNVQVTQKTVSKGKTGGGAEISGLPAGVALAPVGGILNARVHTVREVDSRFECKFDTTGEQIYAIQYRKLKFKWHSSRELDNASLERNNRWKILWSPDMRGSTGEDLDDGEDDVLEVDLTDELDFEFNEKYVSEDGTEILIF